MNKGDATATTHEEIERLEEIQNLFVRRAQRREFPAVKYLIYLQYSALMSTDSDLIDSLVRYGYQELNPEGKFTWTDKITALEVAVQLEAPYLDKILDILTSELLLSEYQEVLDAISTSGLMLQLLALFHQCKYSRHELWFKLEQILVNLFSSERAHNLQ
jgi:hypothetical protein